MDSHIQTTALVASPCYPNSLAWSEENLVAIASGRIITILNPSSLRGPRGVIRMAPSAGVSVGSIGKEDLLAPCLMPISMSRDGNQPCCRSISWSHLGLAPNSGCLLAVCSTDGSVKLYRQPYCEFSSGWVEVADLTSMLYDHYRSAVFQEDDAPHIKQFVDSTWSKSIKRTREGALSRCRFSRDKLSQDVHGVTRLWDNLFVAFQEVALFPHSVFEEGSPVEVLKMDGTLRVWLCGTVKRMETPKALVLFPQITQDGEHSEWFELSTLSASAECLVDVNGVTDYCDLVPPKIRPLLNSCSWPKEVLQSECHEVLKMGQEIEVWLNNRWIEALFVGLNMNGVIVEFMGSSCHVVLDPTTIRCAPIWKDHLKSWQVPLVTVVHGNFKADLQSETSARANHRSSSTTKQSRRRRGSRNACSVTPEQYAYRQALLHSLVVAWSPAFGITQCPRSSDSTYYYCGILAVGGKLGNITFWRIREPKCYTIECSIVSVDVRLIGLLQAHNSWITAISWGLYRQDSSSPEFVVAAGSSNGSVKIWHGAVESLIRSSDVNDVSFSLLKEVTTSVQAPISTLSLLVPKSQDKILIATGRGSGSVEVLVGHTSSYEFHTVGYCNAHDQVVTGLAWAFDGHCLYSSAQDNSVRCWVLHGCTLQESFFPAHCNSSRSPGDMPLVFDSCFGLAVSPGNLVMAVVRSCDVDLLHPMYQARSQKAAVEFYWIGGQKMHFPCTNLDCHVDSSTVPAQKDWSCWESNILWSLKQYEDTAKPLVIWDVIATLIALYKSVPEFVENLLLKWFSSLFLDVMGIAVEDILVNAPILFSNSVTRALHLVNIICRRLVLPEMKSDTLRLWSELLSYSEEHLRERLVAFSLLSVLSCASFPIDGKAWWRPAGVAQMKRWIAINCESEKGQLKLLRSKVEGYEKRFRSNFVEEEKCSFCSSQVPFESPEIAFCEGAVCRGNAMTGHKLQRCAVSMQIFPPCPQWFCVCCGRWVSKLAPRIFFVMASSTLEFSTKLDFHFFEDTPSALCPFCGILLQRFIPDFLLSPSPV